MTNNLFNVFVTEKKKLPISYYADAMLMEKKREREEKQENSLA